MSIESHGGVGTPITVAQRAVKTAKEEGLVKKAGGRRIHSKGGTKYGQFLIETNTTD